VYAAGAPAAHGRVDAILNADADESSGEGLMYKFEVYQDKKGEFRFRFKASNGETMFGSEGYKGRKSALDAIASIKKNAPGASVVEETVKTAVKTAAAKAKAPAKPVAPAPVKPAGAKPAGAKPAAAKPKAPAPAKPKAPAPAMPNDPAPPKP
jgi:uncharacterized protein YegP (UPF0339 family)